MPDVQKMLDAMPTCSTLEAFDNERYFGLVVRFSEKGYGFGEITFSVSKDTGAVHYDPEEMSPTHCAELLMRAVGTVVVSEATV